MSTTMKNPTLEVRTRQILEKPFRFFHCPDFDDPKKKEEILGDMPNLEQFEKERKKVYALRNTEKVSAEMRPCYEEALLTREQEFHLFRKMNYFKYKAKKIMERLNPNRPNRRLVEAAEKLLAEAEALRNSIANSNFRLVTQLLRKQPSYFRDQGVIDTILSDAYLDVLKSVDYFNYNLGNKFSTYCTWVLRKNYSRENTSRSKYNERYSTGMEETLAEIHGDSEESCYSEVNYQKNKDLVQKLFTLLEGDGDLSRQAFALQEWFGLNEKPKRTLDSISHDMSITKERVRQLKESGLRIIKQKVKELGITFDQLA